MMQTHPSSAPNIQSMPQSHMMVPNVSSNAQYTQPGQSMFAQTHHQRPSNPISITAPQNPAVHQVPQSIPQPSQISQTSQASQAHPQSHGHGQASQQSLPLDEILQQKVIEMENRLELFVKIMDLLKTSGKLTQSDADRMIQLKKETLEIQTVSFPFLAYTSQYLMCGCVCGIDMVLERTF
jgi:hypothetical protein